ncbi:unnamed protein product [Rhizoctonia solani]|uniref:Uncharacterized protein n=1 Tax=Rhizoctonia solani TaxID=456999 RepID=A0A8H2XI42_9AGAM|nr:unnamed protein product [Rhizoctonia solani]
MDVDQPLISAPEPFDNSFSNEKEIADRSTTPPVVALTPSVSEAKVLVPSTSINGGSDSPSQLHKATAVASLDEEKLAPMIRGERKSIVFAEGIRRESFPGKHLHTPDVSFNCEEAFIGDKSYSSDVSHDEGMSFMYNARSSTPVSAHKIPLPSTAQKTRSDPGIADEQHQIKPMVALDGSEAGSGIPSSYPTRSDGPDTSPAALKSRMPHHRSPLAFEVTDARGLEGGIPSKSTSDSKLGPGQEFEFVPSKPGNLSERIHTKNGPIASMSGLKAMSARAAALRFILPDDSLMEMDSILDVQFPGGMEDEFTAAFARLALGASSGGSQTTKSQTTMPESNGTRQNQQSVDSGPQKPSVTVEQDSQSGTSSTRSDPTSGEASNPHLEDEHTLNIASLGLSGFGDTLLVDMSLDQLKSKPDGPEHGDTTFGGSSFALANSSVLEWNSKPGLEAQTPKRIASNPLPLLEDIEASSEVTVTMPRSTNVRVVSDAVIDALRSGRALHRATASISSVISGAGLADRMNEADETPTRAQAWPGSTASLRRTESFASYSNFAEPRQYPSSAVLQRTRSAVSLRRTSSATSNQLDFMRPHSRASVDVDSEDDQPFAPSVPITSHGSSRRSSVYALPEPGISNDHPASHLERPSSVASSIYDRPTSAASMRPTSAASIRTSSTRPTSVAGSLRSGTSSRRVSGAHIQPSSTAEDELVSGMEALMRGDVCKASTSATRNTQESQIASNTRITGVKGGATNDTPAVARSGIRQPAGLSTPRAAGSGLMAKSGLALRTVGSKVLSGVPGSAHYAGPGARSTVIGASSTAKTMSAASGRSMPMTPALGTRSATSTLRSQPSSTPSTVRSRNTTLGLFAPDGGPAAGQEPKRPTHKSSFSSIPATPSMARSLRPPMSTSSVRTIGARGANSTTGLPRVATKAGSIASLREVMKSKEALKR